MQIENFLNTFLFSSASLITTNSATFNSINIATSNYSANNYEGNTKNSLFFINGVNIYSSSIISMANSGSNVVITYNTSSMGYNLETEDNVILIGKFTQI